MNRTRRIVALLVLLVFVTVLAPQAQAGECLDQLEADVGTCNAAYPAWWQYPVWQWCVNSASGKYGLCLLELLLT